MIPDLHALLGMPLVLLVLHDDQDRRLMEALYLQHRNLMYQVAFRFFSAYSREAEDAVSDAVLHLCRNFLTVRQLDGHKIGPYIVKVCRSACIDRLRRRPQALAWAGEEVLEAVPDVGADLDVAMSRPYAMDLLAAFPQLSERDRELIMMRHIDGMGYADIAQALNVSEQTARAAVSRAKRRLQQAARGMDPEALL